MTHCGTCNLVMAGDPNPAAKPLCFRCSRKILSLRGWRTHAIIFDDAAFFHEKYGLPGDPPFDKLKSWKHPRRISHISPNSNGQVISTASNLGSCPTTNGEQH